MARVPPVSLACFFMTVSDPTPTQRSLPHMGPTQQFERSLAPDIARGVVLLGIALANVGIYLYGGDFGPGHRPVDGSPIDRILDFVVSLMVNDRSRPMFAILFGFGLATMARRMTDRGFESGQRSRVLVRRNLALIAFGAVHAALLFEGDILGVYGATGLIAMAFLYRRPRVLIGWGIATTIVFGVLIATVEAFGVFAPMPSNYLASIVERITLFGLGLTFASLLGFMVAPMLIGVAMSRAGVLDRPWEHLPLLRRLATAGVAIGIIGGAPYALVVAGVWAPSVLALAPMTAVHAFSGTAMGVGYVCLFGLWAAARHNNESPRVAGGRGVSNVLSAVGERSLTCYLLQSVMFAPLLSPWGLGVGESIGTAQAYGLAVAVWLVTVAVAYALARMGHRGPFEILLRRLTYGDHRGAVGSPQAPARQNLPTA